mmetsp:Transcript_10411/g.11904  ORF Transcript_10411/g.11904 Transcript_10411/m.11904 type:complete len:468 (-) Transcript_10411:423-1826(-)
MKIIGRKISSFESSLLLCILLSIIVLSYNSIGNKADTIIDNQKKHNDVVLQKSDTTSIEDESQQIATTTVRRRLQAAKNDYSFSFSATNENESSPSDNDSQESVTNIRNTEEEEEEEEEVSEENKIFQDQLREYQLTQQAEKWCKPSSFTLLPYEDCNHNGMFNEIKFMAGLTNGLKMMLLAVISSFEMNRCFYVTETFNHLMMRENKTQELPTFIGRYFEPIGLDANHPSVLRAQKDGRIHKVTWQENWNNMKKRRVHGVYKHTIHSLGYENMEGTLLKKIMLERMWRLQPNVRDYVCKTLESHGLSKDYIGFSVRRGDKFKEGFKFPIAHKYILAAENAWKQYFDHFPDKATMPKIFVATDDCKVMTEFRELRPKWTFVSECDRNENHNGFILTDMRQWTLEQTDEHFQKFFVELFGLVGSWFLIGVSYTNVAWWAFYMRPYRWAHQYIDVGLSKDHLIHTVNSW